MTSLQRPRPGCLPCRMELVKGRTPNLDFSLEGDQAIRTRFVILIMDVSIRPFLTVLNNYCAVVRRNTVS